MKINLILSGGGVRSYAHLGVYKYLFENKFEINEIVSVSGGSLIAPFIFLKKEPDEIIEIFKKIKLHKTLFPFWFVPNKFEFLFSQPSTFKIGEVIENTILEKYGELALRSISASEKVHIMATKNPLCGTKLMYSDMLKITDLKNAIASSTAISGIFKDHKVGECFYIDGGHWNNCPIFFDFEDNFTSLVVSNLGYTGLVEKEGGRISKIIRGLEINSFARVQEDIQRWNFEKTCNKRGLLTVINPSVWNINSLDFNLSDSQMEELINAGYEAGKKSFVKKAVSV